MPVTINGDGSITGLSVGTGTIRSIDGAIINATATSLTLHIENMTGTVSIKYYEGSTLVATVTGQTVTSSFTIVTAVPAAVYGQSVGDSIGVEVVDSSGGVSGNRIFLTVSSLPTGGTVTTSGSDRIHTFSGSGRRNTGSGVFINTINNLTVRYLLIGGGGGAPGYGGSDGGGGGGGGFVTGTTTLPIGTYTITVGKGGAGGNYNLRASGYAHDAEHGTSAGARNGGDSKFYQFTAFGGGAGSLAGGGGTGGAGNGGSGGGGTNGSNSFGPGSSISGQGNAGGTGSGSGNGKAGGGGGGAGAVGGNGTNGNGGNGGAGLASDISGSSVIMHGIFL
tara:strand:+ start:884 stop:1888 length:1005 start_codon:yes stop_codon:yes gene_type:complete